jgi:hypothetical protein
MVLTLTLLHVPTVGAQKMVDHVTRVLQILHPPAQHLIPQCGETIDLPRRALYLFFFLGREYPAALFHFTQRTLDSTGVDIRQAVLA